MALPLILFCIPQEQTVLQILTKFDFVVGEVKLIILLLLFSPLYINPILPLGNTSDLFALDRLHPPLVDESRKLLRSIFPRHIFEVVDIDDLH